jgi:hypothetical protein
MSDFLSNLAVRSLTAPSLGSSGRVRPRLPYRFENPALPLDYSDRDEVIGEVHAPSDPPRPAITSRPPAPIDPRPTESPRRPAADFHQPPPLPTPGQAEVATAPDQPPRPRRTRPLAEPDAVQIVPRREPVEPVIRERIIRVVEEAGASLPALDPASSPSPVEPPPRSVPSPREHASQLVVPSIVPQPPEPPSVERRIERAPRVRVTIGRVEVQAAPPPSPPPKPTPQPPRPRYRPAMTLADYLDQRNGGKR